MNIIKLLSAQIPLPRILSEAPRLLRHRAGRFGRSRGGRLHEKYFDRSKNIYQRGPHRLPFWSVRGGTAERKNVSERIEEEMIKSKLLVMAS